MKRTTAMVVLGALLAAGTAGGQRPPSQYYTKWTKDSTGRWYCQYVYKSKVTDRAYKTQYVFWNPKDPTWVYWANPKTNPDNKTGADKYWGRCPTKAHPKFGKLIKQGKDVWSILPPGKRPSRMADLREGDFPLAKEMAPPVPGAPPGDRRTIPCPTDPPDLPK
jgi:hypothetical protein